MSFYNLSVAPRLNPGPSRRTSGRATRLRYTPTDKEEALYRSDLENQVNGFRKQPRRNTAMRHQLPLQRQERAGRFPVLQVDVKCPSGVTALLIRAELV